MLSAAASSQLLLLLLLLIGPIVSSLPPKIDTLDELARINSFGPQPPSHGYIMLWWLCNRAITIDNNGVMFLECNPDFNEYGFHRFHNIPDQNSGTRLLPTVWGREYYAIGNLNPRACSRSLDLPDEVRLYFDFQLSSPSWQAEQNRDRVIFGLTRSRYDFYVDRIYVSDHYRQGATYEISSGLVRQIRNLGLGEFLNAVGYRQPTSFCYTSLYNSSNRKKRYIGQECNEMLTLKTSIQVVAKQGKALLVWKNIPWHDPDGWVGLFKSNWAADNDYVSSDWYWTNGNTAGSYQTSTSIEPGMQARFFRNKGYNSVLRGSEIDSACSKEPTQFTTNGNLLVQLVFDHNSNAGVKLYARKSYDWAQYYPNAWIGFFYQQDGNNYYKKYQWLTNFSKIKEVEDYEVFSDGYEGPVIDQGLQVRVFCDKGYDCLIAMTPIWSC